MSLLARIENFVTNLLNFDFSSLLNILKSVLNIILILAIIFVLYKIIKFVLNRIKEYRIKTTYSNTKKILEKLSIIETKIDEIDSKLTKPAKAVKVKEKHKKKKSKQFS